MAALTTAALRDQSLYLPVVEDTLEIKRGVGLIPRFTQWIHAFLSPRGYAVLQKVPPLAFSPARHASKILSQRCRIMSARNVLKTRTTGVHSVLDAALSRFDLSDPDSYASFLQLHARVLPPVEAVLARTPDLPPWRPRSDLLTHDLADLGRRPERAMTIDDQLSPAECFGLLYVIEGSRLGGRMLLRSVHPDLPTRFLSSVHGPGEWRGFVAELDSRADREGGTWLGRAASGAELGFRLYSDAASEACSAA